MELSLKQQVFIFLKNNPNAGNQDLYKKFNDQSQNSLRVYRNEFIKSQVSPVITRSNANPTNNPNSPQAPSTAGGGTSYTYDMLKKLPIKAKLKLLGETAVDAYIVEKKEPKILQKAIELLAKEEFLEQGEIRDQIYWTSETPPYERPDFLYPWQPLGIDLMKKGHCLRLGSRQKIGKTFEAALADFEDMLAVPGTVVTIVAPTQPLAKRLLRQMFHERIKLKECVRDEETGLWKQVATGETFDLWNDLFKPYFLFDGVLEKVLKNGSRIQIVTLDAKAVQGLSADIIHIEEFDKIVKLTKEGGRSDKLEALAGILPQIRARPDAKIRITCNNRSGLFRLLRDRLTKFGLHFPIYMEEPRSIEMKGLVGQNIIVNEDEIYTNEDGVPVIPDVDEFLEVIMTVLMGTGFVKQQLYNQDISTGEWLHPEKLSIAYDRSVEVDQSRVIYPKVTMGIDPGAVHAYAVTIWATLGHDRILLWTRQFFASQDYDRSRYSSVLEYMGHEIAYQYYKWGCSLVAGETNSGNILIMDYIESWYKKIFRESRGRSISTWNVQWSNFGTERVENEEHSKVISKGRFIKVGQMIFDKEWIILQERNEDEQVLRVQLTNYDPSMSQDKYKGDLVESSLHAWYHGSGGWDKFMNELKGDEGMMEENYNVVGYTI